MTQTTDELQCIRYWETPFHMDLLYKRSDHKWNTLCSPHFFSCPGVHNQIWHAGAVVSSKKKKESTMHNICDTMTTMCRYVETMNVQCVRPSG